MRGMRNLTIACVALVAGVVSAMRQGDEIRPEALRTRLFTIADDSMGGRDTGSRGNHLTADYAAAEFARFGLDPAGDDGTWFQKIPFLHIHPDRGGRIVASAETLVIGTDFVPIGPPVDFRADGMKTVYGGIAGNPDTYLEAGVARGRVVVLAIPPSQTDVRSLFNVVGPALQDERMQGAVAYAITALEIVPMDLREQQLQGTYTTQPPTVTGAPALLLVNARAAKAMLGAEPATLAAGAVGATLSGGSRYLRDPLEWPARNVVGILRGSDPRLAGTFVSVTAHNDHVGFTAKAVDHDSVWAHNHVIRPLGADSRDRPPSAEEAVRIRALRDSLRAIRPSYPDSTFNGADDDGTGTVALMEVARALSAGRRPARSVLFVSHAAEERGLLGSRWFTDHPTVPRDSIVSEIDMDMIGRGDATDLEGGGPGYLEVIGSRRLSKEYGDLFEGVNSTQPRPFEFNYEFDQPGHPLQYYCRADHYSYGRYGIPAMAVSRGEHPDYHQVTDEPEYIDYDALSRVANLVLDFVRTIANLDHRPVLDGPKPDPNAPCRQ
jgi:Peptidase family M28